MSADVTVVIPTIPSRASKLKIARRSVAAQNLQPVETIIEEDVTHEGPSVVRNSAVEKVTTEWVAFLDDDDLFYQDHLEKLVAAQEESGADLVWPWFYVDGGTDPFPAHRGRQWNPTDPHQIPITVLVRTAALREVGGFKTIAEGPVDQYGNRCGEDFRLWLDLSDAGFKFHHIPDITWQWNHWDGNTSGLPSRAFGI